MSWVLSPGCGVCGNQAGSRFCVLRDRPVVDRVEVGCRDALRSVLVGMFSFSLFDAEVKIDWCMLVTDSVYYYYYYYYY